MRGFWQEAMKLRTELSMKINENQGLRNELSQLRMELSLEQQARQEATLQVQVRGAWPAAGALGLLGTRPRPWQEPGALQDGG